MHTHETPGAIPPVRRKYLAPSREVPRAVSTLTSLRAPGPCHCLLPELLAPCSSGVIPGVQARLGVVPVLPQRTGRRAAGARLAGQTRTSKSASLSARYQAAEGRVGHGLGQAVLHAPGSGRWPSPLLAPSRFLRSFFSRQQVRAPRGSSGEIHPWLPHTLPGTKWNRLHPPVR